MWKKIKEHWDTILGCIVGIAGILPTIDAAFFEEYNAPGYAKPFIFLLVIQLVVVVAWVVTLINKFQYEKKTDELENKVNELEKEAEQLRESLTNEKENILEKSANALSVIVLGTKDISKLNNDFCRRIPDINGESYAVLEALEKSGIPEDNPEMAAAILKSRASLSKGMFELYKRYSTQMISHVTRMLEAYLKNNGISLRIACSVKLFDQPFDPAVDSHSKVFVYTAFRDSRSYEERKREIGERKYYIDKNTDFQHCLSKEEYFINNAKPGDGSYNNEHDGFDQYYNCAIVVPIKAKQNDGKYIHLGYLCCDCKDLDSRDVFNRDTARLLYSVAQNYAVFLETLNSNWKDRYQGTSFLEEICQKTYVGK